MRFFIESEQLRDGTVTITGNDAHHITRVLRLEAGDLLECVDPQGFVHLVRVESVGSQVTGLVEESRKGLQESPLHLVLFQGLAKGDKMDLVIQKAVELGAAEVVPFTSRYTVVKLGAKQEENKLRRWERIALEAAKQCGRLLRLSFGAVVAQVKATAAGISAGAYEGSAGTGISQIAAQPKTVGLLLTGALYSRRN